MISDNELDKRLAALPADHVTDELISSRIKHVETLVSGTMTICILTLDNGFKVTGESACVNAENYDYGVGQRLAYDNAFQKLWPLFGFLLAEKKKLTNSH